MSPLIQMALYGGFLGAGALIRHMWQKRHPVAPAAPAAPEPPSAVQATPGPFQGLMAQLLQKAEQELQAQLQGWLQQQALQVLGQAAQPAAAASTQANPTKQ